MDNHCHETSTELFESALTEGFLGDVIGEQLHARIISGEQSEDEYTKYSQVRESNSSTCKYVFTHNAVLASTDCEMVCPRNRHRGYGEIQTVTPQVQPTMTEDSQDAAEERTFHARTESNPDCRPMRSTPTHRTLGGHRPAFKCEDREGGLTDPGAQIQALAYEFGTARRSARSPEMLLHCVEI